MNSDFKELLQVLNELGVEYLVIGGYAVIHYAQPRYTKDIDIWLKPSAENSERILKAFYEFGLPILEATKDDFASEGLQFNIGVPPCQIDFLTTVPGLEFDDCWEYKNTCEDYGVIINYIAKKDLIIAKKSAGRPQDIADLDELEK